MREIYIDTEAPCAKSGSCCLPTKEARRKWLQQDDETFTADGRLFVKVQIATPKDAEMLRQYRLAIDMKQNYIMDIITGTLYTEQGRCLSSNQIAQRTFVPCEVKRKKS